MSENKMYKTRIKDLLKYNEINQDNDSLKIVEHKCSMIYGKVPLIKKNIKDLLKRSTLNFDKITSSIKLEAKIKHRKKREGD